VGALLLSFLPSAASAVSHEVRILLDLDNDPGTGCLVNTVDGPFDGVEQILISTVETSSPPEAGVVTDVATSDCADPMADTFTAPSSFDGGWPVGVANGVGGRDVVETYYPLVASVVHPLLTVRLGVVVTDENGGEQALLTTDDSPDGPPILLVIDRLGVPEIPTLAEWGLILLALLLAGLSLKLLGRRGSLAMVAILALTAAGVAWAAVSLDGLTGEWSPGDQLASNGIVLFGLVEGDTICFRVDVDLLFNSGPEAADDAGATDEDTVLNGGAPGVLANDTDPDLDSLTVSDHDPMSAQGAVVNVAADGSFTYDPTGAAALQALDDGESVDDTFSYTASDGASTDTATVTITVSGVNDAPTAVADNYETPEDTALVIAAPGVLVNDDDVDGDALTAVLDTDVSDGTLTLNADGSFTYTPDMDFDGVDSFTYHANDGTADSPTVTATITVGPVNDGPNAVADSFMTDEDTVLMEPADGVLMNDTDPEGDPLTVTSFDDTGTEGTVTVNADGSFTYDPPGSATLQALYDGEMAADTVD
jgi:VCBS repeat-containing protein